MKEFWNAIQFMFAAMGGWLGYFLGGCDGLLYALIAFVAMPNITPHVCRHTYCSNMAKSGMNPKTLQYLMGHSDIAVTLNVYTHVGLEDAEKELQKMQGLENARKEMGISDKDDKPLKQNMFKVV